MLNIVGPGCWKTAGTGAAVISARVKHIHLCTAEDYLFGSFSQRRVNRNSPSRTFATSLMGRPLIMWHGCRVAGNVVV